MAISGKQAAMYAAGVIVLIQLYRPARTNPPMDVSRDISAVMTVDSDVRSILDRSCNDCHSNRTVWPWYSGIAPISWLATSDVNDGRRHLNFSDWGSYPDFKRKDLLNEACEVVNERDMPPFAYSIAHSDARLSGPEREAICRWSKANTQ